MSITGSEQWMYQSAADFYDFPIGQSLRFEDGDSAYLSKTPASSGNLDAWTFSAWVKRGNLGVGTQTLFGASSDVNNWMYIGFTSGNTLTWTQADGGSVTATVTTSQVFRDVSSFYHIQCTYESSEATGADRMRIYINGQRVTAFSSASYLAQNADSRINRNIGHTVGRLPYSASGYFDGYVGEVNFVDGSALEATSFGQLKSGIWIPKDTAGLTFGTNGFRLQFADSAAIGDDTSGNTNDWTANNLVASDVVPDAPSNNFNTFSSVIPSNSGSLSEGNLKSSSVSGGSSNYGPMSCYNVHSGKWYFEFRITGGTANDIYAGAFYARTDNSIRFGKDMAAVYNGKIYADGVAVQTGLANPTINDVFGFAVDVDNSTCQVYRNGSAYGTLVDFSSSSYISNGFMGMGHYHGSSSTNSTAVVNYGQDSTFAGATAAGGNADENGLGDFAYAPPSGFLSLCSANLPQGAIDTLADETPEDYFNTALYTGNGGTQSITGVNFQPSLTWIKSRSAAYDHVLIDAVRGVEKQIISNKTDAESQDAGKGLTSFDSDGFTVTLGTSTSYNNSGQTYAAWNWKAGGTGVSNTDGSITSTVSVGATSQQNWFSIVGFTTQAGGYTVGHGLGQKPSLIITKNRSTSGGAWYTFTDIIDGSVDYLALNQTSAKLNDPFGLANPTSSVFSLDDDYIFGSGDCIAYCFANAEGLCKVGSYTGNGNTGDGTFVYTGFRPSFLLIKRTDAVDNWPIEDNERNPSNLNRNYLLADTNGAEGTVDLRDFLSNGFKMRGSAQNASGGNYIYIAIAEQPFKYANAR